jgi:hypothetical protein
VWGVPSVRHVRLLEWARAPSGGTAARSLVDPRSVRRAKFGVSSAGRHAAENTIMVKHSDRKQAVRDHARRHGIPYTQALREVSGNGNVHQSAPRWLVTAELSGELHLAVQLDDYDGFVERHLAAYVGGGGVGARPDDDSFEFDDKLASKLPDAEGTRTTVQQLLDAAAEPYAHMPPEVRNAPVWSPTTRCGLKWFEPVEPHKKDRMRDLAPCRRCHIDDPSERTAPELPLPLHESERHATLTQVLHLSDVGFKRALETMPARAPQAFVTPQSLVTMWLDEPLAQGARAFDSDGCWAWTEQVVAVYRTLRRNSAETLLMEALNILYYRFRAKSDETLASRVTGRLTPRRRRALADLDGVEPAHSPDGIDGALQELSYSTPWNEARWLLWVIMELETADA